MSFCYPENPSTKFWVFLGPSDLFPIFLLKNFCGSLETLLEIRGIIKSLNFQDNLKVSGTTLKIPRIFQIFRICSISQTSIKTPNESSNFYSLEFLIRRDPIPNLLTWNKNGFDCSNENYGNKFSIKIKIEFPTAFWFDTCNHRD